SENEPADMSPPSPVAGRMRVAVLIRFLMVDSMCCNPENWAPLQGQSATNRKEILKSHRDFVRSMREQAMITHTDAETCGHPVEENRHGEGTPGECKQGGQRSQVEKCHNDRCWPVQSLRFGNLTDVAAYLVSEKSHIFRT